MFTTRRLLLLGLLPIVFAGCALGVYLAGQPVRENAQLRQQLLHQQTQTRALRGHLDTLRGQLTPPALPVPQPRTYSL